jgi:hypothetical protein
MQIGRKRIDRRKQRRKFGELRRRGKSQPKHGNVSRRRRSTGRLRNKRINRGTRRKKKNARKQGREGRRSDSPRGRTKMTRIEKGLLGVTGPRRKKGRTEY